MGIIEKMYILHGWTYSTDKWQEFIDLMKIKRFDPVLLNIPGLTEKTEKVWTLDDYVEWLSKTIGGEKAIIVGHSNGGRIALSFAAKYPAKVKQLILIDSAGIFHKGLTIQLKRLIFGAAAKLGKNVTSSERLKSLLYKIARESDYNNANPITRQTMVNLISYDLSSLLNKITAPTLIIWGEKDKSTPLSDGKLIHKLIKNSKFFVIKGAKHSPQFTHTNEVCQKIVAELEKA